MNKQDIERIIAFRQELHRFPELSGAEQQTAERIVCMLRAIGVDEIYQNIGGHGVVGVIHGETAGASVALRADMDALPIAEVNETGHASEHQGVMHACGHDGHAAMLMGAALSLLKNRPASGRVVLIFQPAEELGTGAPAMLEDGLLERFPVDAMFGLHNWPGVEAGRFVIHDRPHMASSDDFDIEFHAEGGHGAMPHLSSDPVLASGLFVTALQQIVSRNINPEDIAVVSVGSLQSGFASNVIPTSASLKGTARSFRPEVRHDIEKRIHDIAQGVALATGCTQTIDYRRSTPPVANDPDCTVLSRSVVEELWGAEGLVDHPISMGADDMGAFLEEVPGVYAWIGNGAGCHAPQLHQPDYDFNDSILEKGSRFLSHVARRFLDNNQ